MKRMASAQFVAEVYAAVGVQVMADGRPTADVTPGDLASLREDDDTD